jgi:hypothetical protein
MPTEKEIRAAGPLSQDDPAVQPALKKVSSGVVHGLLRLQEHGRRPVAPPPDKAEGAPPGHKGAPQDPPAPPRPPAATRRGRAIAMFRIAPRCGKGQNDERAAASLFLTPRSGHESRLCWPVDELDGGAP